jgi:hypothetical protein
MMVQLFMEGYRVRAWLMKPHFQAPRGSNRQNGRLGSASEKVL